MLRWLVAGLSTRWVGFDSWPVPPASDVDKVAYGQNFFSQYLGLFLSVFSTNLPHLYAVYLPPTPCNLPPDIIVHTIFLPLSPDMKETKFALTTDRDFHLKPKIQELNNL